jgi:hypothetical protein
MFIKLYPDNRKNRIRFENVIFRWENNVKIYFIKEWNIRVLNRIKLA